MAPRPFRVTANPNDDALSESAQILQNTLPHGLCTFKQWACAIRCGAQVACADGLRKGAPHATTDWRQAKDARGALARWFPTSAFPSRSRRSASFKVWPAAYFSTLKNEQTGKRYLLIEGTDGKVHLIYHTEAIEEARKQGKLTVDNFIRIEKRFAKKETYFAFGRYGRCGCAPPELFVLRKEAELLLRKGIHDVQPVWGGWLGQYQAKLQITLHHAETRKRGHQDSHGRILTFHPLMVLYV